MSNQRGHILGSLMLLGAALFWGLAFVAQYMGMDHVGPYTFQAVRSLVGAACLAPFGLLLGRRALRRGIERAAHYKRTLWLGGAACGALLAVAMNLQQVALKESGAGKAGFLTALYILIVPVYGLFFGRKVRPAVWLCIAVAVVGLYMVSVKEGFTIAHSDSLLILCAFGFAAHILLVDHLSPRVSGVQLSCIQFLVAGLISAVLMFLLETPRLHDILRAWGPILYAGIMSSGVAYTLQIIGQRRTSPIMASLIMSLEAVFAVLGGIVLLGERLSAAEAVGCVLMFGATLLAQFAQLPPKAESAAKEFV